MGQQLALDRLAADDHVQRRLGAQHARQPLGTAGTGNQTQLDFGQCNAAAGRGNAVVATERQLQAAAHRHRMDGGDHRFG